MDNKKKRIGLFIAAIIVISVSILVVPSGALTLDSHIPPDGYIPIPAEEIFESETTFLLIQDVYPWGLNSDELALIEKGDTYNVVNSATLATLDLSKYKCILYASDQPNSYYRNIAANIDKIEAWVSNGGFLIAHVCDQGWSGGDWTGLHILPGNVGHQHGYLGNLTIVDPTHCKVENLDPDYFDGWGSSTHGWLTNLPPGTEKVIVVLTFTPSI